MCKLKEIPEQICSMAYGACDTCGNSYAECDCLDRDEKTITKVNDILWTE